MLFYQGQSVYVMTPLVADGGMTSGFRFSTSMAGKALSRTTFSLGMVDVSNHPKELLAIQSFIGGVSSKWS